MAPPPSVRVRDRRPPSRADRSRPGRSRLGGTLGPVVALHTTPVARVETLVAPFVPDAPAAAVTRTARMCVGIYKAGPELILAREGAEREAYIQELKEALLRYLRPPAGASCVDTP
jgi:hypothetical protein